MLLGNVLPHDKQDGRADQAVLNCTRKQERTRVCEQFAHDVRRPVAEGDEVAEVKVSARARRGDQVAGGGSRRGKTREVVQGGRGHVDAVAANICN